MLKNTGTLTIQEIPARYCVWKTMQTHCFFLSEYLGGAENLLLKVPVTEVNEVSQQCFSKTEDNVHQVYFGYVKDSLGASQPITWQAAQAVELFQKLIFIAENDYSG